MMRLPSASKEEVRKYLSALVQEDKKFAESTGDTTFFGTTSPADVKEEANGSLVAFSVMETHNKDYRAEMLEQIFVEKL